MPRWTYGDCTSGVPLGPIVPTTAPSATASPFATPVEPRCVSVTAYPSAVVIVTDRPESGTVPANVTSPAAGARTDAPASAPTSMPRCWPAAYGWLGSNENGWSTGPDAGHVQALPAGATSSAARAATRSRRRMRPPRRSGAMGAHDPDIRVPDLGGTSVREATVSTVGAGAGVVNRGYKVVTESTGKGRCVQPR